MKLIISASLWHRAIRWYHHSLQHPSHLHLKETMRSVIYWKDMPNTIWSNKSCRSCQRQETQPKVWSCTNTKLVIMTPWSMLCVAFIRQYPLKGKDKTSINFMCLTMIDPAISWFDTIKLPTVIILTVPIMGKGRKGTHILSWENLFDVKVFFLIWVITIEK